ncbi:WW domain-binding protein 11-like [Phyllostomus hastatus]|uniref:WW domain-binding protein 11-like n=1 Tax=Phyllostomus hastatus TaxID=9423 RepID=UPI001E680EE0|nr:WW domain-binding protein 11-like [Phyllostomus hastatus]
MELLRSLLPLDYQKGKGLEEEVVWKFCDGRSLRRTRARSQACGAAPGCGLRQGVRLWPPHPLRPASHRPPSVPQFLLSGGLVRAEEAVRHSLTRPPRSSSGPRLPPPPTPALGKRSLRLLDWPSGAYPAGWSPTLRSPDGKAPSPSSSFRKAARVGSERVSGLVGAHRAYPTPPCALTGSQPRDPGALGGSPVRPAQEDTSPPLRIPRPLSLSVPTPPPALRHTHANTLTALSVSGPAPLPSLLQLQLSRDLGTCW